MSKVKLFLIVAAASFGLTACTKCSEDKPPAVEQPAGQPPQPEASASAAPEGASATGEAMPNGQQAPTEDPAAPMDDDSGHSDGQAPQQNGGQAQ